MRQARAEARCDASCDFPLRRRLLCAPMKAPVIAIDGPTASGKGTIASLVAAALGFHYLESGALYRLVALSGGDPVAAAKGLDVRFQDGKIFLKEQEVTDRLREEAVGNRASEIAGNQAVRSTLLDRQRSFRKSPGLVA